MRARKWKSKVAVLCLCLFVGTVCSAKVLHVDAEATGANNGTSWADAYKYLQDAFADANSSGEPAEILVAQGTYKPDQDSLHPDGTGDREAAFRVVGNVTLRGGYAGLGRPDPGERDIDAYETILSGDRDGNDADIYYAEGLIDEPTRAENSYHVVTGSGVDANAVLDGFTIKGG